MPDNFQALFNSPERRRAQQVAYSLEMVGDIASGYDDAVGGHDYAMARCMLDAFYVHVRLLADFLVRTTKSMDFGPTDFVEAWRVPSVDAATRLAEYRDLARKYVVHFGHPQGYRKAWMTLRPLGSAASTSKLWLLTRSPSSQCS